MILCNKNQRSNMTADKKQKTYTFYLTKPQNIKKSFGRKQVLDSVSFQAESGKAFGLLGRNGAGKTTSIRILMDVFPADYSPPSLLINSKKFFS